LNSPTTEIQEAAKECMKKVIHNFLACIASVAVGFSAPLKHYSLSGHAKIGVRGKIIIITLFHC